MCWLVTMVLCTHLLAVPLTDEQCGAALHRVAMLICISCFLLYHPPLCCAPPLASIPTSFSVNPPHAPDSRCSTSATATIKSHAPPHYHPPTFQPTAVEITSSPAAPRLLLGCKTSLGSQTKPNSSQGKMNEKKKPTIFKAQRIQQITWRFWCDSSQRNCWPASKEGHAYEFRAITLTIYSFNKHPDRNSQVKRERKLQFNPCESSLWPNISLFCIQRPKAPNGKQKEDE